MFDLQFTQNTKRSDLLGAAASGLCLIHCIATPFLFVAQAGIATHHDASPTWWGLIDIVLLLVSLVAVYWAAKKTPRQWMKVALSASWVFLAIVIFNERIEGFHLAEAWIYVPAISLVILHLYNWRYCQCQDETYCTTPEEESI